MAFKALQRLSKRRGFSYAVASENVLAGCFLLVETKHGMTYGAPAWIIAMLVATGITGIVCGTISFGTLEMKRVEQLRQAEHDARLRRINLERRARKALRAPASPAYQSLMRAIEIVAHEQQDDTFRIANFSKLGPAEERLVDHFFGRVQQLLWKLGPSYPYHVRAEAELELDITALATAWDLYYLHTIGRFVHLVNA